MAAVEAKKRQSGMDLHGRRARRFAPDDLQGAGHLANGTLFVAGPPDLVDEKAMWGRSKEPEFQQKMREQAEALEGSRGGVLWALSAETGSRLAEYGLDDLPAFDGMAAANGRLFMATTDHKFLCFE
jgi:hypothetical protein